MGVTRSAGKVSLGVMIGHFVCSTVRNLVDAV